MGETSGENFLPHLTEEVVSDAKGPELDAFAIALEGWRRGLTLKWYAKNTVEFQDMNVWNVEKPGKLFSLASDNHTHYFFRSRGDKVSNLAVETCMDKQKTKELLLQHSVPTPGGKAFKADSEIEDAIVYASSIGFPVVVKPIDGSFGRGVYVNIESTEALEAILRKRIEAEDKDDFLVERFVPGDEYRVYVVDQKVVGVIKRIPANITGDGEHTVKELIYFKNKERRFNPRLHSCPIIIDEHMATHLIANNVRLDDIVTENVNLQLTGKSNISIGGDPVSVDSTSVEKVCDAAVGAMNAIPDLPHAAIDVIWDDNRDEVAVLEINPSAQIGSLLFPLEGLSSDVPSAIIDFYFPETKDLKVDREKLYFDLPDILFPLKSKTASITTVTPAFTEEIYTMKYTVYGDVQRQEYHRGLRKQAFERYLSGFVMNLSEGSIEVVVTGTNEEMVAEFEQVIWEDPERSMVERVEKSEYTGVVKIGFEIKADLKTQLGELNLLTNEVTQTEKKYKKLNKRNKSLRHSLSWKITYPIRLIGDIIRFFKIKGNH